MGTPTVVSGIERLFEAELRYTSTDADNAVVSAEGRVGPLIGSGEGEVRGDRVRGRIRWSTYAAECAYEDVLAGRPVEPGFHLCRTDPGGVIDTDDGATIRFEARGHGLRGYDRLRPHLWKLTMGLHFETRDARYRWLDRALGVWQGWFDETTQTARYVAYLQSNGGSENDI